MREANLIPILLPMPILSTGIIDFLTIVDQKPVEQPPPKTQTIGRPVFPASTIPGIPAREHAGSQFSERCRYPHILPNLPRHTLTPLADQGRARSSQGLDPTSAGSFALMDVDLVD
jgi:hypothetical protein